MLLDLLTHPLYVRIRLDLTAKAIRRTAKRVWEKVNLVAAVCLYVLCNTWLISMLGVKTPVGADVSPVLLLGSKMPCSDAVFSAIAFTQRINVTAILCLVITVCVLIAAKATEDCVASATIAKRRICEEREPNSFVACKRSCYRLLAQYRC